MALFGVCVAMAVLGWVSAEGAAKIYLTCLVIVFVATVAVKVTEIKR